MLTPIPNTRWRRMRRAWLVPLWARHSEIPMKLPAHECQSWCPYAGSASSKYEVSCVCSHGHSQNNDKDGHQVSTDSSTAWIPLPATRSWRAPRRLALPRSALAIEKQAHDRELFAAYCMGVFGPDQSSLKSPSMPACLINEPAEEFSARIADIDQERQRVDLNLRQLQEIFGNTGRHSARSLLDACQIPRCDVVLGRPIGRSLMRRAWLGGSYRRCV